MADTAYKQGNKAIGFQNQQPGKMEPLRALKSITVSAGAIPPAKAAISPPSL